MKKLLLIWLGVIVVFAVIGGLAALAIWLIKTANFIGALIYVGIFLTFVIAFTLWITMCE